MSSKSTPASSERKIWKNDSARQRWDLFHRAIAHAKESNVANLDHENEARRSHEAGQASIDGRRPPVLRLAK